MYKIIDALQKYFRPFSKYAGLILIVDIFVLVTMFSFKYFIPISKITNEKFSDVANANRRTHNADIYFFFADWCPHCVKSKPEWQQFKDKNNGKVVNGYTIICHDIDCTKEGKDNPDTAAKMQAFDISSFPTVKMTTDDGKKIDFDAKISAVTLDTFINSVLV